MSGGQGQLEVIKVECKSGIRTGPDKQQSLGGGGRLVRDRIDTPAWVRPDCGGSNGNSVEETAPAIRHPAEITDVILRSDGGGRNGLVTDRQRIGLGGVQSRQCLLEVRISRDSRNGAGTWSTRCCVVVERVAENRDSLVIAAIRRITRHHHPVGGSPGGSLRSPVSQVPRLKGRIGEGIDCFRGAGHRGIHGVGQVAGEQARRQERSGGNHHDLEV